MRLAPGVDDRLDERTTAGASCATTASRRRRTAPIAACPLDAAARSPARAAARRTRRSLARFGSTPCKAQYRCRDCLEPFDYFKAHELDH